LDQGGGDGEGEEGLKHTRKNPVRKPYYRSRAFDKTCRSHGGCPRCEADRHHQAEKAALEVGDWEEFQNYVPEPTVVARAIMHAKLVSLPPPEWDY
jgi:hypothetical protein